MAIGFSKKLGGLKKIGLKKTKELIGVDIGTSSIRICVLTGQKEGFKMRCIDMRSYDEDLLSDGSIVNDTFVARELKSLISRNRIENKNAACALSSYSVITKRVTLPFLEKEALENTINFEIESVIPFPLKDIYYSYYVMGIDEEKEDMITVQIVAAKRDIVEGYLNVFHLAGLNLQLLDVDIFCITNLIEEVYNPKDYPVVVADIGASVTNLAIMKGDNIEFTREILIGGKHLTHQIERSLRITYKEAEEMKLAGDKEVAYLLEDFMLNISSEINKTINFYTSTKPKEKIGKIFITGGASILQGLKERIEDQTKTEVEHINPWSFLREEESNLTPYERLKPSVAVALYLSSRAVDI